MTMDMLTELKSQVEDVIKYSQGYKGDEFNCLPLLEQWFEAKKYYIERWDGKLIYEVENPVSFELSAKEKLNRLDEFINTVSMVFDNEDLADFLYHTREDFFNNCLSDDYWYCGEKISKGMKITRAFKFFADGKALEDMQTMASMLLQEDKVTGKLCFSVHPLDFLSSSENNHKWRSCHALDGEYRSGNLSYMVDKCTVICYLRTDGEPVKLPHFPSSIPWNDKKWRMLLFVSKGQNCMMAGRQYPFFSKSALDVIAENFIQFNAMNYVPRWSPWYHDYLTTTERREYPYDADLYGKHINMNCKIYSMEDIVIDKSKLHYNDLLFSTCYTPYYCWYRNTGTDLLPKFEVGGEPLCPCCGKHPLKYSDLLVCVDCGAVVADGEDELFAYCSCCDTRVFRDDMRYVESFGSCICPNCYETETQSCERCGVNWGRCDLYFNEQTEQYLCPCCREPRPRITVTFDSDDWDSLPF